MKNTQKLTNKNESNIENQEATKNWEKMRRKAIREKKSLDNENNECFVYITDISPSIKVDLKYATTDNFTGTDVPGYNSTSAAIATQEAANSLKKVQNELNTLGLGLKIFDSYRPHRAAQYFKKWCLTLSESF